MQLWKHRHWSITKSFLLQKKITKKISFDELDYLSVKFKNAFTALIFLFLLNLSYCYSNYILIILILTNWRLYFHEILSLLYSEFSLNIWSSQNLNRVLLILMKSHLNYSFFPVYYHCSVKNVKIFKNLSQDKRFENKKKFES